MSYDEGLAERIRDVLANMPDGDRKENGDPDFSNYIDDNINTFLQELEQLRNPVVQQASIILDSDRIEIFMRSKAEHHGISRG